MPRYYFHLASKDSRIPDDDGRELAAEAWKVIISSDEHDGQIIIPFDLSYQFPTSRGLKTGSAR